MMMMMMIYYILSVFNVFKSYLNLNWNFTSYRRCKRSFKTRYFRPTTVLSISSLIALSYFPSWYVYFNTFLLSSVNVLLTLDWDLTRTMAIANGTCVSFCYQPKAHYVWQTYGRTSSLYFYVLQHGWRT